MSADIKKLTLELAKAVIEEQTQQISELFPSGLPLPEDHLEAFGDIGSLITDIDSVVLKAIRSTRYNLIARKAEAIAAWSAQGKV